MRPRSFSFILFVDNDLANGGVVFMNHLVYLDAQAGELEKILSGVKTMLVKEFDPTQPITHTINPGDSLYFLRSKDDCVVRVKATAVRVLSVANNLEEDLPQTLKVMQPRLQLAEEQYNHWSAKKQVLLVEFEAAHKIAVIQIASHKTMDRSDWIAFDDFSLIS
jgi:hypothetical protein